MKGMHKGPVTVDRDGAVKGMIPGDVIVRAGVWARIDAMVGGDVIVEDGAEVHVDGMVAGRIIGTAASVGGMVAGGSRSA